MADIVDECRYVGNVPGRVFRTAYGAENSRRACRPDWHSDRKPVQRPSCLPPARPVPPVPVPVSATGATGAGILRTAAPFLVFLSHCLSLTPVAIVWISLGELRLATMVPIILWGYLAGEPILSCNIGNFKQILS